MIRDSLQNSRFQNSPGDLKKFPFKNRPQIDKYAATLP